MRLVRMCRGGRPYRLVRPPPEPLLCLASVEHRARRHGLVAPTTPLETEPWRERYFQVTDPNGVVIQLVQWVTPPPQ
jgi:hypothetical protein